MLIKAKATDIRNIGGYSLFEMLIALALSGLMMTAACSLYPLLQIEILRHYQQFRLEQSIHNVMLSLTKDLKRAGFIANHPETVIEKAIIINHKQDCVIIRYDSKMRGKWVYQTSSFRDSDIFSYRYHNHGIEYKTNALDCKSSDWDKLLDPKEIKVTFFSVKPRYNSTEITLNAELKKNSAINYQYRGIIRHENNPY